MRILDFTDGFASNSAPSQGSIKQNAYAVFATDAAFVIAKGAAATLGDVYSNSTTSQVRYFDGTTWEDLVGVTSVAVGINHISSSAGDTTAGWVAFKDAAASTPADGTGGVSTLTFASSVSSPLRGSFSFLLTKGAANLQGEGVSTNFTIDSADVNKRLLLSFDYEVAGSFVSGSASDVGIWIYDVTNSVLITPQNVSLLAGSGEFSTTFLATNATNYRLIYFVRTTNALAWSLKFDNVIVSPQALTVGSAPISDWQTWPSPSGSWVTNTTYTGQYRRVGSDFEGLIRVSLSGAPTATALTVNLPAGFTVDTNRLPGGITEKYLLAVGQISDAAPAANITISARYNDTASIRLLVLQETGAFVRGDSITNVSPITFATGDFIDLKFSVPVSQWDSNVVLSNSRTTKMSSLLQFGTRVTATPAQLGEYRTLIKAAAALTSTDDLPSTSPTAADGMRIYGNANFASAGTAGQTNKWVVYVGPGKVVDVVFFGAAAKTGHASADYSQETTLIARGALWDYDPTTGLVVVDCIEQSSTTTTRSAGYSHTISTTAPANLTNMYFDILVSDTPVPMDVAHASTHIIGGVDIIDADRLAVDFVASNYTPVVAAPYTLTTGELTSHLKGIDNAIAGAISVANTSVTDTANHSTTSATFVVVTTMTITPAAGTYLAMYSASGSVSINAADVDYALHLNGVEILHSRRNHDFNGGGQTTDYRTSHHTQAVIVAPGGQAIDVRIRTNAGTITTFGRSLTLLRLA